MIAKQFNGNLGRGQSCGVGDIFGISRLVLAGSVAFLMLFFAIASASGRDLPQPIQSALEVDYPPFCIVYEDGRVDGFSVELMRAALDKMGREVTFRTGAWAEVRGWLERGEVDALPLVGRTPEREELFEFTVPYMTMRGAIVVRKETEDVHALADLRGRRVAVLKGDNAEEFLRREDRGLDILTTPTFSDAFLALSEGLCDAVVIQRLVALRLLEETGLTNLKIVGQPISGFEQEFCFAVKAGDREMLSVLNEGLALAMADGTHRRLHAKWFGALELPSERRIVIGGDHDFPPYEYLNARGLPEGFNVDLSRAVAREMGLDIEIQLGLWSQTVQALEAGEIDALQGMFYSEERSQRFDFTVPFVHQHYVSVVRTGAGAPPESFEALQGLSVAVQESDLIHEIWASHDFSGLVLLFESQEEVLEAVADGRADCGLVMRLSAARILDRRRMPVVLAKRPIYSAQYCMAVKKGNTALLTHLNEGLRLLQESGEYRQIQKKWLGVLYETPPLWRVVVRYLLWIAAPVLAVFALVLFWNRILRRLVAERTRELREQETFLRAVLNNLPVGVAVNSAEPGVAFHYMNDLFPKIYRTTRETLSVPDAFWRAVYGDDRFSHELRQRILEDCASGDPARMYWTDVPIAREGEDTTYVTARNKPIHGTNLMISSVWDVTERKQAEEELAAQYRLLRVAGETARFGGWSVDLVANRCIWSDVVADIHEMPRGYTPSLEEGIAFYAPEWRERITQVFTACAKEGTPYDEKMQVLTRTGKRVWVRTTGAAVRNEQGDIVHIQGSFQDITEQKHSEEEREKLQTQLIQAQKMESVGRLAGGVAHDFNNILQAIMGYSAMLVHALPSDSELREFAEEIAKGTNRAAELTHQLLAFARKQTISPKVLDLNDAVEPMLKMLRRLIGEDIDLAWKPAGDLWSVKVDSGQVDQILANLCVNARDAIDGMGKVTIETENVALDEAYCALHAGFVPGEFVMLAVSDDGCGMDEVTSANIFEPFFTTKDLGEGTGLGLATVYGIVKQNEGLINVYSEPGQGTTFRIYLPRHAAEAARDDKVSKEKFYKGHGEMVLFVEDDASILRLGKRMLEAMGYDVRVFGSPGEALEFVREKRPAIQLLITDVVMPEMTGRELADAMRRLSPEIRVLFMSGYTANVIAHRGVLDEGVDFIQKPFSTRDLAKRVREALDY